MTRRPRDTGDDLRRVVERQEERERSWEETGERSMWKNVALLGALGWLIVLPPLAGGLIGRWIDGVLGEGYFWSGLLIVLGIMFGAWLAWQRAQRE